MTQCNYRDPESGWTCGANAVNGSPYCLNHEKILADVVAEGRRRGGEATARLMSGRRKVKITVNGETVRGVNGTLNAVAQAVLDNRLDCRRANTIAYILAQVSRNLSSIELEARLETVEVRLGIDTTSRLRDVRDRKADSESFAVISKRIKEIEAGV